MATDTELREMVAAQRREVADLIEGLDAAQIGSPSLCAGWTVKDVAAHLTIPFHTSTPKFVLAVLGSMGNFDKAMLKLVAKESSRSVADIVKELRDQAEHPFTPPGGYGPTAPLVDALVHTQDIRRPLGLGNGLAPERIRAAFDGMASKKFDKVLKRQRFDGIRLEATDQDYTSGNGATVSGTSEAILMTMLSRPSALDDLAGDGVSLLRSRTAS